MPNVTFMNDKFPLSKKVPGEILENYSKKRRQHRSECNDSLRNNYRGRLNDWGWQRGNKRCSCRGSLGWKSGEVYKEDMMIGGMNYKKICIW